MHMWMWFGYDLGEFLFPGLNITSRWSFALTWIALFFTAFLFEGSKVYLAQVQKNVQTNMCQYRSDERRNLLCSREPGVLEPTTSRNVAVQQPRWVQLRHRFLLNMYQALVFVVHNVVGYLLMLAVMIYNVHLMLAVIFGMMLGYFLFGTKLTRVRMQCIRTKSNIICTPECDDTADGTTPPLLEDSAGSESDYFICQTRTCVQGPSTSQSCQYGSSKCPSKVARAKRVNEPKTECCEQKESQESESEESHHVMIHKENGCCKEQRDSSPEVTCCNSKSIQGSSQEHIVS